MQGARKKISKLLGKFTASKVQCSLLRESVRLGVPMALERILVVKHQEIDVPINTFYKKSSSQVLMNILHFLCFLAKKSRVFVFGLVLYCIALDCMLLCKLQRFRAQTYCKHFGSFFPFPASLLHTTQHIKNQSFLSTAM